MKTTLAATLLTMLLALGNLPACGAEATARPHAVPMVHATDLFRPPNDPDDPWDLACVYALVFQGRIDLKGVLIDFPPPALHTDPDVSAVAQLNYLTGQAVPALVGASRTFSRDQARDAALQADLRRIRAVLEILRQSLQYVLASKEAPLLAQQGTLSRNMWCTAGFLHAAGLTVSRDGRIVPLAEASDAVFSFDPIRIQCAPNGVTQWAPDATAKNRFIFHVRDLQHYQSAMISPLRSLLTQLP